jgi:hypothetical protein
MTCAKGYGTALASKLRSDAKVTVGFPTRLPVERALVAFARRFSHLPVLT